jgi:hypothetical protein
MLTWRSTAVRLIGASLVGQRQRGQRDSRRIPHEFRLVACVDDNAVDPFRVAQLSTPQEHLIWSDRNLGRRRAGQGSREVEGPIVRVE